MDSLRRILVPIGLGLGILALIGVTGSALILYREASAVHPALGIAAIALLLAGIGLLVIVPVARIGALPPAVVRPEPTERKAWRRYLQRYADRLLQSALLSESYPERQALKDARHAARGRRVEPEALLLLESEMTKATQHLDRLTGKIIVQHAAAVFVATGASQSGRLDGAIVLSTQLRMIKEIAELYYQRPRPRELWELYSHVGASAFLAGEIEDSELLAVLGAPVSAALSGFVPVGGSGPLVSLLVHSLLDGSANALLTLRVGLLTRRYCAVRIEASRRDLVRGASLEAASLLSGVVAQGARRIAGATRRLAWQSATQAPDAAARGITDIGTGALTGLTRLAGKMSDRAARASQETLRGMKQLAGIGERDKVEALRSTETAKNPPPEETPNPGSAVAADTVRFWERVADFLGS